jgi:hypothetical protein
LDSLEEDGTPVTDMFTKEVRIKVSNSGSKRYKVSQLFRSRVVSTEGIPFDTENLRCHVQIESGSGTVRVPNPTPIRVGEQELFVSDAEGLGVNLIVIYSVLVPEFKEAGDYHTAISYRAQTL